MACLRAGERAARVADPVDMGTVALFLVSEAANYITGQTLVVDGGMAL